MPRLRFATLWLGGCSGCHMSFLDLDEWLIELAQHVEVVYCPLVDAKEYPENVHLALVEGAVTNDENLHLIRKVRARTKTLVSIGDCAGTGNVTALRNSLDVLRPVYAENGDLNARIPDELVPVLLECVQPVHAVVPVDFYLPGCPPPAHRIKAVLQALVEGRTPRLEGSEIRFG
jgi:NAD-reducing hydrogenase small subunit